MSAPLNPLEAAWCDWLDSQDAMYQAIHAERPALSRAAFAGGVLAERARVEAALIRHGATGSDLAIIRRVCAGKE